MPQFTILKLPVHICLLFAVIIVLNSCKKSSGDNNITPVPANNFLHTNGKQIVDKDGKAIKLQGVAFGNEIWNDVIPVNHHNEADFERLKNMHMNVVRFYMNYKTLEDDSNPYTYKQSGWDWLDKNIAWAKKYGIYLILNMHAPQGGYQSQGQGDALWNDVENQNRLTALWTAIAKKYKEEATVIGFGLVNEPVPVNTLSQWQQLAQRIATAIRVEDKNHILFVEKPIYVKNAPIEDENLNFPLISDNNTAYEFHFYDPHAFTHQLFSWANTGDGGKYPDDNVLSYINGNWYTATFNNPTIAAGNSDWHYFEGEKYKITDAKITVALPALVAEKVGGTVYFDDMLVKEFDAQGNFTKNVLEVNLNNTDGWSYWSQNNSGAGALSNQIGHTDAGSLYINAATGDCNFSNYTKLFVPKQGYSYQICGWMKGDNIAANAACKFRIDFISADGVYSRNKEFLSAVMKRYIDWGNSKNVPLYLGEYGAGVHCFEDNKGGLQWVSDMVDICKANNLYFTYHAYHEDSFGIYIDGASLPSAASANQPLIDLFTQKFQ